MALALTATGQELNVSARASGLTAEGDTLWARGAAYKAAAAADGVTFVPALGRRSARTRSLSLRLGSIGRGAGETTVLPADPFAAANAIVYERGACRERYDVRAEGLEQSFVFAHLPPGDGDLVVRMQARTDLPLGETRPQRLRFVDPEVGGVELRDVIGIDADGRRAEGSMRCIRSSAHAETYELALVLPASFVATATLPLVLDPMLGTVLVPGAGPDDSYPDVAYEPTTDRWFVVWDRSFSLLNIDLVGQRLDGNGALVGSLVTLRTGLIGLSRNRVVAVDARDTFVAAWWETGTPPTQTDIVLAGVHAATGAVSPALVLAVPATSEAQPDLGVASPQDDAAVVVWESTPAPTVRGTRVTVSAAGTLSAGPIVDISPPGAGRSPSISHGVAEGRLLVGYVTAALTGINGAVLGPNLQVLATAQLLPTTTSLRRFALDGDGGRWVLAYEVGNNLTTGDLFTRWLAWNAATSQLAAGPLTPFATSSTFAEKFPAVGWLGNAAAIGHVSADYMSATYVTGTAIGTVDGFACTPCEGAIPATTLGAGYGHFDTRVAVRPIAGAAPEVLLIWGEDDPVAGVAVKARRFRSDDGLEIDQGGGCGGGTARHGCARTGNTAYSLQLTAAPAMQATVLVVGTAMITAPCGPCTIVPDPATGGALLVGTTTAAGTASLPLPIPAQSALVGYDFSAQWLTLAATGACFGFAASNALGIRLQ